MHHPPDSRRGAWMETFHEGIGNFTFFKCLLKIFYCFFNTVFGFKSKLFLDFSGRNMVRTLVARADGNDWPISAMANSDHHPPVQKSPLLNKVYRLEARNHLNRTSLNMPSSNENSGEGLPDLIVSEMILRVPPPQFSNSPIR